MARYDISKSFGRAGQISERDASVMRMFGLTADRLAQESFAVSCQLEINDGDIVYITGPSGAGKSVLLREIEKAIPDSERVNLNRIELAEDKSVIDCIDGDFVTGLKTLSVAGLGDAFCVLNRPVNLSDGQKYRFRLAVALSSGAKYIFADEFCNELDRITAAVISYNIRKYAKQKGVTFILASSHDDILLDLAPDVLVVKELSGATRVVYK
ncbi:MAG: ATP-binding cassette domain-containing protein [Phycisphaerae bacterium]|nr:ATP-binding cassette domain-containing protein [Phycisphaerae bacterium]MDD5380535.1 ATP-binding cassette domain-containing protein [Phycisphaerae bacterium]